jgi:hypothetical protein
MIRFLLAANAEALKAVPIGKPISDLYSYSLRIVGVFAFVMFLYAGVMYMLPESMRPANGTKPLEIIKNVIIGVVLLFSAYVILNTLNPALVGK